ncbi:MAG TPA: DUF1579 family protein [Gemmataceae bacterium]|nr:DUF1579 family protein [Gemmataceae bacterium]
MARRWFPSLAVLIALMFLAGSDNSAQVPADPQSKVEPRSNPGIGQKFLQQFVGDWDVVKLLHLRSGDPLRMTGECRQTMMHEGRFLKSEFVFRHNGSQSTGLGMIGFEAESGIFTSVWTDSRSTRMSLRQSKEPFDGKEIVLYGRSLNDDGKGQRRSRTVTQLEEDGQKIVHRAYVTAADGKEALFMELLMSRKGKTPPAR